METNSKEEVIYLRDILGRLKERKKLFLILFISFITFGLFLCFTLNTEYKSSIEFLPEQESESLNLSSFGGLAGLAGISLPGSSGSFDHEILPDIVYSKTFLSQLLTDSILLGKAGKMTTQDYFMNFYKPDIYENAFRLVNQLRRSIRPSSTAETLQGINLPGDLVSLTEDQVMVIEILESRINVNTDLEKKIITIATEMPTRVGSASLTDVVYKRLIQFLDEYRAIRNTNKIEFLTRIKKEKDSLLLYHQEQLGTFLENNRSIQSQYLLFKEEMLKANYNNALDLKQEIDKEYELAKIGQIEEKLYFKVLKTVIIPNEKDSPRRMMIMISFCIMSVFFFLVIVMIQEIWVKGFRNLKI